MNNTASLTRNATVEIIDIEVSELGISPENLVRPIVEEDVDVLAETDESEWEPVEVRIWPNYYPAPPRGVRYHVMSGNHRTMAARKKGSYTVKGKILDAPDELSYKMIAIKSNTRHGKNFTQEQRLTLAYDLSKQGMSLAEIAKIFAVHKSTVGNWLSGRDSNASKKRLALTPDDVAYATNGQTGATGMSSKLLSWIAVAPLDVSVELARQGLRSLPSAVQEKAQKSLLWLAEVLENEVA